MKSIFGIFSRDSGLLSPSILQSLQTTKSRFEANNFHLWSGGGIVLGGSRENTSFSNQSSCHKFAHNNKLIITSAGRIDNISELGRLLNIPESEQFAVSNLEWIQLAYDAWGEKSAEKIYGDWTFAVWHPVEKRLFLARDHFGNTALYYYVDRYIFAFACSRQVLIDLNLAPIQMDELYLAQVMLSWPGYNGERTIHTPICRLPPAHTLTVSQNKISINQYWHLEKTQLLHLQNRQDYVIAFQDVFNEAVRDRLRTNLDKGERSSIAVTLSGGLDSSSVAITAARLLSCEGNRLAAFTSIPLTETKSFTGSNFGDEFPLAALTAQFAGNIDHFSIDAKEITPIQGIRRMLQIIPEPAHAAANFYWLLQLEKAVSDHGCKILLTGQMGNAGISWAGDVFSQSLAFQLQRLGLRKWLKEKTKLSIPQEYLSMYRKWRLQRQDWCRSTAIHPDFARKLNLFERRMSDPDWMLPDTPMQQRLCILPGRSILGALHAEMGVAHNIEIRDPTADVRVLAFTFSVPDHIFIDPRTRVNRWLIREAMKGRLPEEVRLNRKRGRQSGDLVPRLRASAGEVESSLNELEHGPAAMYVDVDYMRKVWRMIQTEDTVEAFVKSITILTRGIMAGLFVNKFYE